VVLGDKQCTQNFDYKLSFKMVTCKTEYKKQKGSIQLDHRVRVCEDWQWMEPAVNCVTWQVVLAVLC
jgi:hypothetical protein